MQEADLRKALVANWTQDETIKNVVPNDPHARDRYLAEAEDRADDALTLLLRARSGKPITKAHDLAELRVVSEIENRLLREEAEVSRRELEDRRRGTPKNPRDQSDRSCGPCPDAGSWWDGTACSLCRRRRSLVADRKSD